MPNIDYLVKTGMKLVHPDYINIYQPLLKCNELELITELNSHSLIKHLINRPNDEYEFFKVYKSLFFKEGDDPKK